jgi:hypothetical protein
MITMIMRLSKGEHLIMPTWFLNILGAIKPFFSIFFLVIIWYNF